MMLRKKMLLVLIACLIGFQPQVVQARDEWKIFAAFVALYYIRPIGAAMGNVFSRVGEFLIKITRIPKEPDSPTLTKAKNIFDREFKKFKSDDVVICKDIYNNIAKLAELTSLDVQDDKKNKTIVGLLKGKERKASISDGESIELGSSSSLMHHNMRAQALSKLKEIDMTSQEYEVYQKTKDQMESLNHDNFIKLVDYMKTEFTSYRRDKNKTIITLCAAHTACEHGTIPAVKKIALNSKPSEIVTRFHAAVKNRNGVNEIKGEMTHTSTGNVLSCFHQA